MIVFGIRHFKVKTYSAAEFGLTDPSWNATQFVAAQQYFHVMYIPMFPTGKFMATRGRDGKLYHLSPQVAAHVKSYNLKHKTPWYTFIGPMFLLLMGIGSLINNMIEHRHFQQYSEERNEKYRAAVTEMLEKPSVNDYYRFAIDTNGGQGGYVSHQTYAVYRVMSFDNNSITFRSAGENPWAYCSDPEYSNWPALFSDTSCATFRISKNDLRSTVIPSADMEYRYDGAKISIFGKPRYFKLETSHTIDGPEFDAFVGYRSAGDFRIEIDNRGDSARNISFTKLLGDGDWSLQAEEIIPPNERFYIDGKAPLPDIMSFRLDCTGRNGKRYSYVLSKTEDDDSFTVKRLR